MSSKFRSVFGTVKLIIAMVHCDANVADVLKVADGCIVGSSLKVDGDTWNAVDPDRAAEFMRIVRATGRT